MDKQLQKFLKTNLIEGARLTRLDDRSKRKNLQEHRKNVFLVETGSGEKWVLLHFFRKYKIIFNNYLKAKGVLSGRIRGQDWIIDEPNLFILMPYLGNNFVSVDSETVKKIARLLLDIYVPSTTRRFSTPRYLKDLIGLNFHLGNINRCPRRLYTY